MAIKLPGSCCVFVVLMLPLKYVKIDPIVHLYAKYIESVTDHVLLSGLIDYSSFCTQLLNVVYVFCHDM